MLYSTMHSFSPLFLFCHHCFLILWTMTIVPASAQESCTVLEFCRRCTDGDRRDHPECQSTGIVSIVKCLTEEEEHTIMYQVCQRTKADEEFLMIRLQVFCLVLGVLSLLSVRKQKSNASSLFDQRMRTPKANGAIGIELSGTASKTRHEGTLSRMTSREEEKMPLTQHLDVV